VLNKLTRYTKIHRLTGGAAAFAMVFLMAATASATVIGTVNVSSGQALVTVTGTSIAFSPPCDSTALGSALFGGCAQGEVGSYNPGTPGTPAGPLQSSLGTPEVASAVFIAPLSASTTFPVIPFMQFLNNTATAIAITTEATAGSFGSGTQSNCTGLALFGTCSIYQGALIILQNLGAQGTAAILPYSGVAWDGSSTTPPATTSNFAGSFTTQLTFVSGITGTNPGGFVSPADIQAYFGCPNGATGPGSCSNLARTVQSSNSATFTATISAVPEPESMALSLIGGGLLALGLWRKRSRV
jgi:hypothetical protein